MAGPVEVRELVPASASPAELQQVHAVVVAGDLEALPDDRPTPFPEMVEELGRVTSSRRDRRWTAASGHGPVVGYAELQLPLADNLHLGWGQVLVQPGARRRGAGRALMEALVAAMAEEGRTSLTMNLRRAPAAAAFLSSLGFDERLVEHQNRLRLADVDVDLLHRWVDRAPERAAGYSLRAWDGPTPPDLLERYAAALGVMNTAPRDDLEYEDEIMTPARLADRDQSVVRRGRSWWTLCAVEDRTGEIAGLTELFFSQWRDDIAFQGNTGVGPAHRNKGLGRWLKATMLLRLLAERPSTAMVDTGNAASNDAMLGINHALGFRPVVVWSEWQAPVEVVARALAG